jgi:hypothetical protein
MQSERHGKPVVLFDKEDLVRSRPVDEQALLQKQKRRLSEIVEAFLVYRTTVFKELDRENAIDAFAFYYSGMLRPLIEVMGLIYRPYCFDFGFRYLKQSLPADLYRRIEPLFFVAARQLLSKNSLATPVNHPLHQKASWL